MEMENFLEPGKERQSLLGMNRTDRLFWSLPKTFESEPEKYGKHKALLVECVALHYLLDLPMFLRDCEGGEHYAHKLTKEDINALRAKETAYDFEVPDSIVVKKEERPWGYNRSDEYGEVRYNPWGDLIMTFRLTSQNVQRNYTFTVFLETGYEISLNKYTRFIDDDEEENEDIYDTFGSILGDMIGHNNPDENNTSINDIDEIELNSLVQLIKDMKEVAFSNITAERSYEQHVAAVSELMEMPYEKVSNNDIYDFHRSEYKLWGEPIVAGKDMLLAGMEPDLRIYVDDLIAKMDESRFTPDYDKCAVELLRIFSAQTNLNTANNHAAEVYAINANKWHSDALLEDAQRSADSQLVS